MKINLDHIENPATKSIYRKLLNLDSFYLSQYSERQNPLKLSVDEKKIKDYAIVDQTNLVVIAIVVKFDNKGLILRTPFETNTIAFNVFLSDISIIKLPSIR